MTWVSFRPMNAHVSPPSVDLKMPPPGEIEFRESSSPVPTQTMSGLDGAIARSPIEITRSSVQSCRNVVPLFVVFQMPDAAPAT